LSLQLQSPVPGSVPDQSIPPGCGYANRDGLTFQIKNSGDTAQEAELPWVVLLLSVQYHETVGGGSLIKPDVVLSATTVTRDFIESELIVRAGEWDLSSDAEHGKHEDVAIRKIVHHPYFMEDSGANNVALLFLERPLQLTRHINLICLPPTNRAFMFNRCVVSGWGKKTMNDVSFMNLMKKVEVPLVDSPTCEQQLRVPYTTAFNLHDSLICAGGEIGKDSCKGDGGAPLACPLQNDPNRYEQVGIVNFGFECGNQIPAAYTDVSKMRPWIEQQIQVNSVGSGGTKINYPYGYPRPVQGPFTNNGIQGPVRIQGHGQGVLVNNANDPYGYQRPVQGQGQGPLMTSTYDDRNGYQRPGIGPVQGQGHDQSIFVSNRYDKSGYQGPGIGPVQGQGHDQSKSVSNRYDKSGYQGPGQGQGYGIQVPLQGQGQGQSIHTSNRYDQSGFQAPDQGQGASVNNGFYQNGYQLQGQGQTTIRPKYDLQHNQEGRGEGGESGTNRYGSNQYQGQSTSGNIHNGYDRFFQGAAGTNGNMDQNRYQTFNEGGGRYDGGQGRLIPAGGGVGVPGAGQNYYIGGGDDETIEYPKQDNTIKFDNIPTTTTPITPIDMNVEDA